MYINSITTTDIITLTSAPRSAQEEASLIIALGKSYTAFAIEEIARAVDETTILKLKKLEYMVLVQDQAERLTDSASVEQFSFVLSHQLSNEGHLFHKEHMSVLHTFRGFSNGLFRRLLACKEKEKEEKTLKQPLTRLLFKATVWIPLTFVVALCPAGLVVWNNGQHTLAHLRCDTGVNFVCQAPSHYKIPSTARNCELYSTVIARSPFGPVYWLSLATGLLTTSRGPQ